MLSGYKVFSRRFVKSFPALAAGFETETELTVHALELRMPIAEVETPYRDRPRARPASSAPFATVPHPADHRGADQGGTPAAVLLERCLAARGNVGGAGVAVPDEYLATGLVPRLPTAVLVTGLMILAFLSVVAGSCSTR